jgi:chaperone required for assembly of F1-ATPase
VCRLSRKQERKKIYKENLSKTFAKADKPFACHLEGTNL